MFILKIFYNIFIYLSIPFALPVGYIFAYKKGEQDSYFERFGFIRLKSEHKKSVWFHCASVGEVKSIKSLVDEIRNTYPDYSVVCSTMTATGKSVAEKYLSPDEAFLLPIENSIAIKYLIDVLNTKIFFIVDTELWPNLINSVHTKCKLCMVNGRISDKSFNTYKRFSFIFRPLLRRFQTIFVKSTADLEKFSIITGKKDNIINSGNIKFMQPAEIKLSQTSEALQKKSIFLAASTHVGEEDIIFKAFSRCNNLDHLVVAPRHINRADSICAKAKEYGYRCGKLTELDTAENFPNVIVVDKLGLLEELYYITDKIFIGGSLIDIGGHNIFEALQFRKYISTGPYMQNFQEIMNIAREYDVIKIIENEKDLVEYITNDYDKTDSFDSFFKKLNESNKNKMKMILKEIPDGNSSKVTQ